MHSNKRLDGWQEIADYLGRTVRTAQRWERELELPIRRVKGQQSVFALIHELDEWVTQTPGTKTKENSRLKKRSVILFFALSATLVFTAFAFFFSANDTLKPLSFKIRATRTHSFLDILDDNSNAIHTFQAPRGQFRARISEGNRGCRFFSIIDLNGDEADDVVIALDNESGNRLEVYLQEREKLQLYRTRDLDLELRIGTDNFGNFQPIHVEIADVTGDHKPEILLTQRQQHLYPGVLRVFSLNMRELLRVWHPGRLTNCKAEGHDLNGNKEIYVAGTNNTLSEFSTPILFVLQARFANQMMVVDLISLFKNEAALLPPDFKLTYISLRKDPSAPVAKWETATLNLHHRSNQMDCLQVTASPCLVPPRNDYWGKELVFLRCFMFDSRLRINRAYFNQESLERTGLTTNYSKQSQDLLRPLYWDGKDWQESFTIVTR